MPTFFCFSVEIFLKKLTNMLSVEELFCENIAKYTKYTQALGACTKYLRVFFYLQQLLAYFLVRKNENALFFCSISALTVRLLVRAM